MQLKNPVRTIANVLLFNAPIDAQLVVTRRCNLSCGYCSEYDSSSEPVPLSDLRTRIDSLHRLKSANITLLGGEPLMHPQIAEVVAYAARKSHVSIVTNGFLLRNGVIEQLNEAGLNNLTVSIDTLYADPTRYIQKSLQVLRPRLERLNRLARFDVHVAAVLCESSRDQFRELVNEIRALGLRMSVNLIHDMKGHVDIGGPEYMEPFEYFRQNGEPFTSIDLDYSRRLLQGEKPSWKCRAGSRYLYVDEVGKVQLCASQMGRLAKPVEEYTFQDIKQQSGTYKGCEEGCSVGCVYRCSRLDNDKPGFVTEVVKGYVKGTMRDNNRGNRPAPRAVRAPQRDIEMAD